MEQKVRIESIIDKYQLKKDKMLFYLELEQILDEDRDAGQELVNEWSDFMNDLKSLL